MVSELEKLTTHVTKAWTMSRAYKQGFASCFRGPGAISDAPHIRPCYEDTRVPPFSPQYQGRGGGEKGGKKKTFSLVPPMPSLGYSMASQVHR